MRSQPNTLDYVRRIKDFDQRLEYLLGLDNSEFEDLDIFRAEKHNEIWPYSPEVEELKFRFKSCENEAAIVAVVGIAISHYSGREDFTVGYESNVFQLCLGIDTGRQDQRDLVGIIVARQAANKLGKMNNLLLPQNLDREIAYMKKVFRKIGLPQYANDVAVRLDYCFV
jgi:hypothetical protein